jgi:hypothetical protein
LRRGETVPVRLERLEAALFLIVPAAIGPFTAIGLTDKLVAADAVLETAWEGGDVQVRLKDGGTFSFVSERKPLSAFVDGKPADVVTADEKAGLYRVFCPTEDVASRRETVVRIEL